MKDNSFDKLLQEKLQGHEHAATNPDWGRMEKALNQLDQHQVGDSEIRNRLKNHEVPYQPSHWEILKKKLELEKNLKRRIVYSKVAEVVILLLVIFSVYHVKEYTGRSNPVAKNDNSATLIDNSSLVTTNPKDASEGEQLASNFISSVETVSGVTRKNESADANNEVLQSRLNKNAALQSFENSGIQNPSTRLTEVPSIGIANEIELNSRTINQSGGITQSGFTTQSGIPSKVRITTQSTNNVLSEFEAQQTFNQANESTTTEEIKSSNEQVDIGSLLAALIQTKEVISNELRSLEDIDFLPVYGSLASIELKGNLIASPTLFTKTKKERWIGLMSGIDANFIGAPFNFVNLKRIPNNDFIPLSVSTGISYGIKNGANEYSLGVSYSAKTFDPELRESLEVILPGQDEEITYYERDYTLEKYEIVSLPIQYRRHFNHDSKLHSYAFGGLSANVVLFTDFQQRDDLKLGRSRDNVKYYLDEVAQFQSDDFTEGLIQGGYYKDNIFLTAFIGAGVERQFNRAKVFIESQYTRNLFASSLGPRNAQIKSVSLNVGAKYRI